MFWSYLPHPDSGFFHGLLILQGIFSQNFIFFLNRIDQLGTIQPVHRASLCGALIFVILEPKSYMDRAHRPQISPRHCWIQFWTILWVACNPPWVHLDTWWLSKGVNVASYGPWNRGVFMKLEKFETEEGSSRD